MSLLRLSITIFCLATSLSSHSQKIDSIFNSKENMPDKHYFNLDKKLTSTSNLLPKKSSLYHNNLPTRKDSLHRKDMLIFDLSALYDQKSFIKVFGGFLSYNYNYRSYIDTPFIGTSVSQHYLYAGVNVQLANVFPVRINYLMRYSNSTFFKTINDIQVIFDGMNYRNNVNHKLRERLLRMIPQMKDSLQELSYHLKLKEFIGLDNWLQQPTQLQKLIESHEIIQIPGIARDFNLPDSVSKAKSDSIIKGAQEFISLYLKKKDEYDSVKKRVDSLKKIYDTSLEKIEKYKKLANTNLNSIQDYNALKQQLNNYNVNDTLLKKYKWLLGIKQVAIGKNLINYSELTAKNINSTGVNFQYNSWYYLAFAAGTINYRYRDFLVKPLNKSPQFLYIGRLGFSSIQRNTFIISVFRGQKQIYAQDSSNARSSSLNITGVSLETKWWLNRNSYLQTEVAQSQIPPYSYNLDKPKKGFNFSDKTNKALSVKINYYLPKLQTRVDGMYKYTGANYQSFSSFQTNSSLQAWHVKVDQFFLKRSFKISASAKSNEYTNPFIIQNYKSNTVFKSFNATFHKRYYPTISIAYSPIAQLTKLNNELSESKFYSLTSNLNYAYKLKDGSAITSIIYSKFYNTNADSSFIFYNSSNLFINQTFINKAFTQGYGISFSKNNTHELLVVEGSLSFNIKNYGCIGIGAKINNLSRLGTYWNLQLPVEKIGRFSFMYDQGYLPGNNYKLIKNDNMNIGFMKTL